nr:hypothetical protein [Tanacetum cinerariifolium]
DVDVYVDGRATDVVLGLSDVILDIPKQSVSYEQISYQLYNGYCSFTFGPMPIDPFLIVVQLVPEVDDEEPEENIEEDMTDIIVREKDKEEIFSENRSKVLQGDLPETFYWLCRPDKSAFVLEHDDTKYPLDEKLEKEKKKGNKCGKSFAPRI